MVTTVAVACCETHSFNGASSPTVSRLGTSMVLLMMSCAYEAWARTKEHDVLVFTKVCDVSKSARKGSLWFVPWHVVMSKGTIDELRFETRIGTIDELMNPESAGTH
ncbi:hypothetical protein Tco_0040438 [Tanacetum coccineum]